MRKRTRNGKIARLPRKIRDELNTRLDNGEEGGPLLAWLNALPEVQAVLREHFGGQPINHQNLSDWRQGGFADWQRQQETMELAESLLTEAEELEGEPGDVPLSDRLGPLLTLALARTLRAATQAEIGPAQHRELIVLAREFTQIRRTDHEEERVQLARERWEAEKQAAHDAELKAMEKEIEAMEKRVEWHLDFAEAKVAWAEIERRELLKEGKPVPEEVLAIIANKAETLAKIKALREDWQRRRPKWRWFEREAQGHSSPFKANQAFADKSPVPEGGAEPI